MDDVGVCRWRWSVWMSLDFIGDVAVCRWRWSVWMSLDFIDNVGVYTCP